ncbi:uncharacterized protein K02A2.6-like [Daktulosphaira vitifoliae]|uniref:uncharacterized protein K02A2.6-like n=1 Tax=Daktulosphaira vitifoliae TaxID=58002 RepID=UPI0021AA9EC8|nr:uncharacterized protein K02A2.6-like [Daktulosphaira vitifoliae]
MEFNKPEPLKLTGNLIENFKIFKQEFQIYYNATECSSKKEETQAAILLNLIGTDGIKVYNTLKIKSETVSEILKALENYCIPRKNEIMEHYKFFSRKQGAEEPFDNFYTDLRKLIKTCGLETCEDKLLRTQIVLGILNKDVQASLLREDLSLDKVVNHCRAAEQMEINRKTIQEGSTRSLFNIETNQKECHGTVSYGQSAQESNSKSGFKNNSMLSKKISNKENYFINNCTRCGKSHKINMCPAFKKICSNCGGVNHFKIMCKKDKKFIYSKKQVNSFENANSVENYVSLDALEIMCSEEVKKQNRSWIGEIIINDYKTSIKLDTCAELNVMPSKLFNKLKNVNIDNSNVVIKSFGGYLTKSNGKVLVELKNGYYKCNRVFEIVNYEGLPLLSYEACIALNYIKKDVNEIETIIRDNIKENFISKNKDVFEGIGKFPDKINIKLVDSVIPKCNPPRRVPNKLMVKLKEQLDRMIKLDIIQESSEPSEWQSNLVIIEKPDKSLRLCLDPREINKYVVREMYQIPLLDDMRSVLSNKSIYSLFDLKEGFYHCELDSESVKLCTFSSPFGSYSFKRLPFGLSMAPEIFQKLMMKYFGDIPGVLIYFDDLLVCASSREEHDKIICRVLERARKYNIKFNSKKLQYATNEVKFLGFIFNEKGVKPDNDKIQSIQELTTPINKKQLQSFLGMINYLRAFLPNLSERLKPFRELLKKNVLWNWSVECERAFCDLKESLCNVTILANFNNDQDLEIQCDASEGALGCCIFQNKRPIYYASRCLSEIEKTYAQIEKEMLAISFACTKFHSLIYGRKVTVFTDHQPLVSIMLKELNKIPNNRIRRLRMKCMLYDIKVKYLPGREMYVADLLSRNYIKRDVTGETIVNDVVHAISEIQINFSNDKEDEFKRNTGNDEVLKQIMEFCKKGWLKVKCEGELKHYWKLRNEIYLENGLIYYGSRLVIPKVMRQYIIKKLHEPHFGISKTKARAKQLFYYPGINNEIENWISACPVCLKFSSSKTKEPLKSHFIPNIPFYKIALDIAEYNKINYLIIEDYYSRWLEVIKLGSKTSESVVIKLKEVFSKFGIPNEVVADNMPFGSVNFHQFAKEWNFKITNTSPQHAQSNGLAEKGVGIAKNMLKKCLYTGLDFELCLLMYRNTPVAGLSYSPAQLLQSRELRSTLIVKDNNLKPNVVECYDEMLKNKQKQKEWYDKTAKFNNYEFREGHLVYVQDKFKKVWEPGTIIKKLKYPRSFLIKLLTGSVIRRNVKWLKRRRNIEIYEEDNDGFSNAREETNNKPIDNKESSEVQLNDNNVVKNKRTIKKPQKYNDYVF